MNEKDLLEFKNTISNYSIEELLTYRDNLNSNISKMLLESDLVIKVALVESLIKEKQDKKNG